MGDSSSAITLLAWAGLISLCACGCTPVDSSKSKSAQEQPAKSNAEDEDGNEKGGRESGQDDAGAAAGGKEAPDEPETLAGSQRLDLHWPTFQGDNRRTGFVEGIPELASPKIRWGRRVGILGYLNSPLLAGDLVIVPSSGSDHNALDLEDGLHAFDAATGRPRWHARSYSDANGAATDGDVVVFTSDDTHVRAIDVRNGKERWSLSWGKVVYSVPLIQGRHAVVGDAEGLVVAIDLGTGERAWEAPHEGSIRGGLAGDGEHVFVVSQGGDVAAYDKEGNSNWKRPLTRPMFGGDGSVPVEGYGAPVIDGSRMIVPFARDTYYESPAIVALNVEDGAELWRGQPAPSVDHWGNLRSSPALAGGKLVFAEPYSGDIAALFSGSGKLAYRVTVGESRFPQYASPAVAGNTAYVPRHDGHLYAVDVGTGAVRWSMYLGRHESAGKNAPDLAPDRPFDGWASDDALYAPPAIGPDGTVYVGSGDGYLYAIGSDAAKEE